MHFINTRIVSSFSLLFFVFSTATAIPAVDFFASDNTKEMNLQIAYERYGSVGLDLQ